MHFLETIYCLKDLRISIFSDAQLLKLYHSSYPISSIFLGQLIPDAQKRMAEEDVNETTMVIQGKA